MSRLFEINPAIDRAALAAAYARDGRVQVRDLLAPASAEAVAGVLARETPWGMAWKPGDGAATGMRREELAAMPPERRAAIGQSVGDEASRGAYTFLYARYPMLEAYLQHWQPDHPLDRVFEALNDTPMLELVRQVAGIPELVKADAQATLFGPGNFLSLHSDAHVAEGWRIAYILNFARDWKPDWGGYLTFFDDDGDITGGFRPRFNALNLIAVPQLHNVSYVPPFAPVGRFAITGWYRDRV